MPAPAVIPAPVVYFNIVAVKTFAADLRMVGEPAVMLHRETVLLRRRRGPELRLRGVALGAD